MPGSFFTSARLIYVAGKEGYLPALFGRHNKALKTPLNAMCLQAVLTIAFIVVGGGFRSLINFAVVASWAFYFLTVCQSLLTCPRRHTEDSNCSGPWPRDFANQRTHVGEASSHPHLRLAFSDPKIDLTRPGL